MLQSEWTPLYLRVFRLHSTQHALEHCLHTLVIMREASVCGLLVPGYVKEATEDQTEVRAIQLAV